MTTNTQFSETAPSLHEDVMTTVRSYFANLEGDDPVDLYKLVLEEFEVPLFKSVMLYTNNNQSRAARLLGLSRGTLRTKLRKYFDDTYVGSRD